MRSLDMASCSGSVLSGSIDALLDSCKKTLPWADENPEPKVSCVHAFGPSKWIRRRRTIGSRYLIMEWCHPWYS